MYVIQNNVLQVHATTEEIRNFIKQMCKQNMTLIPGDFNAKVGRKEKTIGSHSNLHERSNDNDVGPVDMTLSNKLSKNS